MRGFTPEPAASPGPRALVIGLVVVVLAGCGGVEAPAAPTPEAGELRAVAVALALIEDGLGDEGARATNATGLLTASEIASGARSKAILRTRDVAMFVDVFQSAESAQAVHEAHVEECPACHLAACGPIFVVARTPGDGDAAAGEVAEAQRLLEARYGPC